MALVSVVLLLLVLTLRVLSRFLRDNYVHGDLHGGNLMAADDGTLAVFDAGLTTALKPDIAEPVSHRRE